MSSSSPSLAPPSPQLLPSPLPLSLLPPSPPKPPGPSVSVTGTPAATRHTKGLSVLATAAWTLMVREHGPSRLAGGEMRALLSLAPRLHRVGSLQMTACVHACGGGCLGQCKVDAVGMGRGVGGKQHLASRRSSRPAQRAHRSIIGMVEHRVLDREAGS